MDEPTRPDDPIDETVDESFPASDRPEWMGMHAGSPHGGPAAPRAGDLETVRSAFPVDDTVARVERGLDPALAAKLAPASQLLRDAVKE